jgi:hypothetical protein
MTINLVDIHGVFMYKKIVFVDLENIRKIDDEIIEPQTKLFIMVGKGQDKQALDLLKEKFDSCAAMELIKVNGQGHNALDFFIVFYLGKYYNELKDAKIIICTKDGGFDPLQAHLCDKDIDIIRIGDKIEKPPKQGKKKERPKTEPKLSVSLDSGSITKKVQEICGQLAPNTKTRPRKLKTLKNYLRINLKQKYLEQDADKIIAAMQEKGMITVTDKSKGTIRFNI